MEVKIKMESGLHFTADDTLAQIMVWDKDGVLVHVTLNSRGHAKVKRNKELVYDSSSEEALNFAR